MNNRPQILVLVSIIAIGLMLGTGCSDDVDRRELGHGHRHLDQQYLQFNRQFHGGRVVCPGHEHGHFHF